jgi:hypothetical protein
MAKTSEAKPPPGYAFVSSTKKPREPEMALLGKSTCAQCSHVGFHNIDGSRHYIWKVKGKRRYYFTRFAA